MQYVDLDAQVGGLSGVLDPIRYLERLPSIADALPPGARTFTTDTDTDTDHYNFRSTRCVKNLELPNVQGADADGDEIELQLRHNCWKHDADLTLHYNGVCSFDTSRIVPAPPRSPRPLSEAGRWTNLGTVILDENLHHKDDCSHEMDSGAPSSPSSAVTSWRSGPKPTASRNHTIDRARPEGAPRARTYNNNAGHRRRPGEAR